VAKKGKVELLLIGDYFFGEGVWGYLRVKTKITVIPSCSQVALTLLFLRDGSTMGVIVAD
jgi:hypothetical protein